MSFEARLKKLQDKSVREKKSIALVTTLVVFLPLMGMLFYIGAFSLSGTSGSGTNLIDSFTEETDPLFEDFVNEGGEKLASTSAAMEELREIASTTNALINSTSSDDTIQEDTASTSDFEVASTSEDEFGVTVESEEQTQ